MAINLKQISFVDSNQVKLDKVNYNFDQIVANGGGPRGFQGTIGETGYQGLTGHQGNQGTFGDQGSQGSAGNSGDGIWTSTSGPSNTKTIMPVAVDGEPAPSVIVGYKSTDTQYQNYFDTNSSFIINRGSQFLNNLELRSEGVSGSFYYRTSNVTDSNNITTTIVESGFAGGNYPNKLNTIASKFEWIDEVSNIVLLSLDKDVLTSEVPVDFVNNVDVNGYLKLDVASAGIDKIAVSKNSEGEIEFKTIEEIGGVVPVGTIVSIDPLFFVADNFIIEDNGVTAPSDAPINIRVGAGVNTYGGWYICHGKDWTNGTGTNRPTTALNSFSYSIDENPATINPNSQGVANVSNNNVHLIGGAEIEVNAAYSSPSYNVTGSLDTSDESIQSGSGTSFIIKRLPQIIFLGEEGLFWKDAGSGQAQDTTVTYKFTDQNETASKITSIPNSVQTRTQGSAFSFTRDATPTSGYEFNGNAVNATVDNSDVTSSINYGGLNANIVFNVNVASQPTGGTVEITFDSTGIQTEIANEAPTAPTNLRSSELTQTSVTLEWDASTDDSSVASYSIYKRIFGNPDELLGTVQSNLTEFGVTGQNDGGKILQFYVKALDDEGLYSLQSANLTVTMLSEIDDDPDTGGGTSLKITSQLIQDDNTGTINFRGGEANETLDIKYTMQSASGSGSESAETKSFNIPSPNNAMGGPLDMPTHTSQTGTIRLDADGLGELLYTVSGNRFKVTITIEDRSSSVELQTGSSNTLTKVDAGSARISPS